MAEKKLVLDNDLYYQYYDEFSKPEEVQGVRFLPLFESFTRGYPYRTSGILFPFMPNKKKWLCSEGLELIDSYPTVVIPDSVFAPPAIKYIHKRWPSKRLILWYKNAAVKSCHPSSRLSKICELWSFDERDCEEYHMRFNHQFYYPLDVPEALPISTDVSFVGLDKGRLEMLQNLQQKFESMGLRTKFNIVGYNSERFTYPQIVKEIAQSRAVLDIQASWQTGMTLRPFEAMFYQKKLITNDFRAKDAPFYTPENVFILGEDDLDNLSEFIYGSEASYTGQMQEEYSIRTWSEHFDS